MKRLAQVYIREIVKLHEVPESIVSDRDPRFQSIFWRSLSEVMGTKLQLSTAAHPQTDGQSERTIQILEDMLRTCVLDFGKSWDNYSPLVEFTYNNSISPPLVCFRLKHYMIENVDHRSVGRKLGI